ncbi:MAG: hypothetical protein V4584_01530 [Verrucomicrobiota bacterium]
MTALVFYQQLFKLDTALRLFVITDMGGVQHRDVVLRFQGTGTPGPEITDLPQPGGKVKTDVKWTPGGRITLFYKLNGLAGDWTPVNQLTMDANGEAGYLHNIFGDSKQFYRRFATMLKILQMVLS